MTSLDDLRPTRRQLLVGTAAAAAASRLAAKASATVDAVAFDAFVLFDPQAIRDRALALAGPKTAAFVAAASSKLFAYTWFYTSAGRYRGFEELAGDAFQFAAATNGISLSPADLRALTQAYSDLRLWPDVADGIARLRRAGRRLVVLSNMPEDLIAANLARGGVGGDFEHLLSTDRVSRYKPAPEAYRLGTAILKLPAERIAFAASAGWDAAGATWFGYPTVWVNRTGAPAEQANFPPRLVSPGMDGVLRLSGLEPLRGASTL
jgi:2-haloacid dehalogenase